jgi:uncharacterized protein (TIGR02466 family)
MAGAGSEGVATPAAVRALLDAGRGGEAVQAAQRLLASRPGDDEANLLMAQALSASRGPAAAGEWLQGCAHEPAAGPRLLVEAGAWLLQEGRAAEALPLLRRAVAGDPSVADAHAALGFALQSLERFEEAEGAYRAGVQECPQAGLLHFNLGTVLKRRHRFEEATDAYREAVRLSPAFAPAWQSLGTIAVEHSRFEEAAEALGRAAELAPQEKPVLNLLGFALLKLGRGEEAVEVLTRLHRLVPERPGPRIALSSALLAAGRAADSLALCEELRVRQPGNRQLLANQAIALTECGRAGEAAALLRHDRFLWKRRIECPPGFDDLAAFNAALVAHALSHPGLNLDCNAVSCHNGQTSDELLVEPKGPVALLERAIHDAAGAYLKDLQGGESHPFLASQPGRTWLSAWVTILRSQGHQFGHIHPTAWLSGVYYVSLPPEVKSGEAGEDGWIEFGAPPRHYRCAAEHAVTRVRPEEGLLVLFPSFYYHRTLPFRSAQQRVTIAFDFRDVPP